jgi:DNA-binding beta-propeller fold protein YncE
VDTAAIIDLEADPPRVVDQVVVGDGPEGLAVSPKGGYAVEVILNGANLSHDKFYYHPRSYVSLLKVEGKKVRKVSQTDVGGLAEGVAFSPDGDYLYVGNFLDSDITILRRQGDRLVKAGTLKLPGHPASMRASTP